MGTIYLLYMKQARYLLLLTIFFPTFSHAMSLQETIGNFTIFLINTVVPFLLGIGFLFFAINVIRYFVAGSGNEEGRKKAKNLAIYSVLGFVVILVFWGIVNMLTQSIGLTGNMPTSDYIGEYGANGNASSTNQNPIGNVAQPNPTETPTNQVNIACVTITPEGNKSIIITSPAACTASGGTAESGGSSGNSKPSTPTMSPGQNDIKFTP